MKTKLEIQSIENIIKTKNLSPERIKGLKERIKFLEMQLSKSKK
jgi:hypothetical protein